MGFGFFKKANKLPKRGVKRVVYNKFCAAGSKNQGTRAIVASENKNCDFADYVLRCSVGATRYLLRNKELDIPLFPEEYGHARDLFIFEYMNDGELKDSMGVWLGNKRFYIYDEMTGVPGLKLLASNTNFSRAIRFFNRAGDEKIFLCYNDKIYSYDPIRSIKAVWMEQKVTDACFFNDRLFICDGKTLKYSAADDYRDFNDSIDGGGAVKIASEYGEIIALIPLGEVAYVFLEYGIYKLRSSGAARDFVLEDVVYKGGTIYKKSICVCEDKIAFLASDGIYLFDGKKLKRYGQGLPICYLPQSDYCKAGYGFGRYFLSFEDASGARRSVFVDFKNEDNFGEIFALHGVGNWNGKVLCVKDRAFSYLDMEGDLPTGERYLFKCDSTDFSVSGEKFVRAIELCGKGECFLTIRGRNGEKILNFNLSGKEKRQVGLKGEMFSIEIELTKGCEIRELAVDLEQVGGGK